MPGEIDARLDVVAEALEMTAVAGERVWGPSSTDSKGSSAGPVCPRLCK